MIPPFAIGLNLGQSSLVPGKAYLVGVQKRKQGYSLRFTHVLSKFGICSGIPNIHVSEISNTQCLHPLYD